jgi:hypothetical protein
MRLESLVCLLAGCPQSASVGFCFLACSGIKRCRISGVAPFNSVHTIQSHIVSVWTREDNYFTPLHASGTRLEIESSLPCGLKLNRGGSGRPLGKRQLGSRSSSKKGCTQASNCMKPKKIQYTFGHVKYFRTTIWTCHLLELLYNQA